MMSFAYISSGDCFVMSFAVFHDKIGNSSPLLITLGYICAKVPNRANDWTPRGEESGISENIRFQSNEFDTI